MSSYKRRKRGFGKHVQLPEALQATEAWSTLKVGPRALYIELKRRYNGYNNGRIYLSHRMAAEALNVHRNTIGPWFKELENRGLIRKERGHCLGTEGVGISAHWALCELPTHDGKPVDLAYRSWKPQIEDPRTNVVLIRHNKRASGR